MFFLILGSTASIASALALSLLFFPSHTSNLLHATTSPTAKLSFTPTRLTPLDTATLILLVLLKYLLKLIGLHPPFHPSKPGNRDIALPPLILSAPFQLNASDLQKFTKAVQSTHPDDATSSPLLLAAATAPLLLVLLAHRANPVLPFGAVNTGNRFEFREPAACRAVRALRAAQVTARVGGDELPGRRVKRGVEFAVVVEVTSHSQIVFRQVISILALLPKAALPLRETPQRSLHLESATLSSSSAPPPASEMLGKTWMGELELAYGAPTAWAAVCKDVNPIHVSALAATVFGFPGRVAHGNLVVARVVEMMREEGRGGVVWQMEKSWWMEVAFRRPVVLPVVLGVRLQGGEGEGAFEVLNGKKACVVGRYGVL
ncbi:uncharacterized protein BDZ99DRAFT_501052 [Mytilinidion resinicola]|uniref:MaoC-like domain-containing protein n=1 Tax=Mytilinidion resinicola TaxID=574789 RepID=A0A6A6YEW0_9PEZI|nr:uncharacterized protein BDZ99DRAFT_501052 [Mytilinidion resinicola]KAF2807063.1 hypothetical protein BDZ99DRAFT_501052 [Mytilinidion resinicola]